jgi:hypothetical protein
MRLDRGLSPLLLAAYMRVPTEEQDRQLREIMHTLLQRGARITQLTEGSGATVMHLLACHPLNCSVMHRMCFLLTILLDSLEQHRNGATPSWIVEDAHSLSLHLLGVRDSHGMLPEDLAPAGYRSNLLRMSRLVIPRALQEAGEAHIAAVH